MRLHMCAFNKADGKGVALSKHLMSCSFNLKFESLVERRGPVSEGVWDLGEFVFFDYG